MEFWRAIGRLARNPRVSVPTLLVALSAATAALVLVPPTYVASTTMVLTTTEFGGTESRDPQAPTELVNPMLTFNDSLRTSADMLIWSMTSKKVQESLSRDGRVVVTVNDGRTNPELLGFNGPIVYVSGTSTDPNLARAAVIEASDIMRSKLQAWQADMGAPTSTYITMLDVVTPTKAEADHGYRVKLAVLTLLACVVLGMAVAYAATRLLPRRPKGEQRATDDVEPGPGRGRAPSGARTPAQGAKKVPARPQKGARPGPSRKPSGASPAAKRKTPVRAGSQ